MYKNHINSIFYKLRTCLFVSGVFFSLFSASALEIPHDIVLLETVSVVPLRFDYLKTSEKNTLLGKITNVPSHTKIGKIIFSIIDRNQAILWEKKEDKPENLQQNKLKTIPFKLKLPTEKFPKNSELKITLLDSKQNFLGTTQKKLPFASFSEMLSISDLNVSLPTDSPWGTVSFLVSNKEGSLNFYPQIRISLNDVDERSLFKKIFPEEQINEHSNNLFSFSFDPPRSPGLYSAELLLLDKDRQVLSGKLKKSFLIKGSFARITVFDTSANRFLNKNESLSVAFQGFAPESPNETIAEISIQQKLEGKIVDYLFQSIPLSVKSGKFSGITTFPLEHPASQFITELKIKQGSDVLASKIFKSKNFSTPPSQTFSTKQEGSITQKVEKIKETFSSDWILWGTILFLVLLIVLNGWLRQEKRFFLLLLAPLLLGESAFAAVTVFWHHPIANWSFNPMATEEKFLPFGTAHFQGNIFDNLTQHGFFQETPIRIIVKLFKDGEDIYIEPESFMTQYTKTYDFEINLPTTLNNGSWGAQILFKMNDGCGESGWCGTTWQDSILIDTVAPTLDIIYDSDPDKILFQTALGTSETTLQLFLSLKEINITLRRQKISDKNDKVILQITAVQTKTSKENTRIDKIEKKNILQQKLVDNLLIVDRRTEADEILKAALEAAIAIIEDEITVLEEDIVSLTSDIDVLDDEITTLNGEIATLNLDILAPEATVESLKQSIRTIKRTAKKDSVAANIACSDGGASCHNTSIDLTIRGNFCDSANCDSTAPRNIKVCDNIGNCTTPEGNPLEIDWYDPVKPTISQSILWKNKGNIGGTAFSLDGSVGNTDVSTGENIAFEISATDFENPTKITHPALFDEDACGSNVDSFLFAQDGNCAEIETVCAISSSQRGVIDEKSGGTCVTKCEPGYIADGSFCVLNCDYHLFDGCLPFNLIGEDCENTEWLPLPESIENGVSFVQMSNCGSTRQAVGLGTGLHQVEASLRFNSSLSRTLLINSDQNTWTWSGWVKRGDLDRSQVLFNAGTDNSNWTLVKFDASNRLHVEHRVGGVTNTKLVSTALFRDPNTWSHIVITWDTANASPGERVRFYLNGVRLIDFDTSITPSLNNNSFVNSLVDHFMGKFIGTTPDTSFDGLLSEIIFVDGQSLSPTSFGEYNPNNQWVPKAFAGNHGTNGFHLNFSNAFSLETLGDDVSGNNNHWTLNDFELNDSLIDSPTNNFAVLNPLDSLSTGTFSNGNLTVSGTGVASFKNMAGSWYWEEDGVGVVFDNPAGDDFEIIVTDKTVNFGQGGGDGYVYFPDAGGSFLSAPPFGYKAISSKNLPSPAIENSKKFFDTLTYTGNGGSQFIDGLEFSPSLIWIKNRNISDNHFLFDSARGSDGQLSSNNALAEINPAGNLTSINSLGFSLANGNANLSGNNYVAWNWKNASESGVGIINYVGDGLAGKQIPHGLGATPEVMIVKNRDSDVDWSFWHKDLDGNTGTSKLILNSTLNKSISSSWNDTPPSNSFFTVNDEITVNEDGANHIAYLFAEKDGFSSFGKYTGNGTLDGTFIFTGFKPGWIMVKKYEDNGALSPENWIIWDAKRDDLNPVQRSLYANSSGTEAIGTNDIDFLSNGFKLRNTDANGGNLSGDKYIYLAFAQSSLKTVNTIDCHEMFLSSGICFEFEVQ